jgi:hypothetical protein
VNTLGWVHQEFANFPAAQYHDEQSVEQDGASRTRTWRSAALINLGLDRLRLDDVDGALGLLGDTQTRVEKFTFGAHRWRWGVHPPRTWPRR